MILYMALVHEPVCIYMCDVLCAFERNCDLVLSSYRCSRHVRILTCSVCSLIQAITKLTWWQR